MARFSASIDLPIPPEEAFDYLADFRRTVEWDPGVAETQALGAGSPGLGSRFRVVVRFLGRRLPLEYRITGYERPHRLVLEARDGRLRSVDTIRVEPRRGGSRVHYDARIDLSGLRRLADPLLHLVFQHTGRLAVQGLENRFARPRSRRKKSALRTPEVRAAQRGLVRRGA